MTPIILSVSHLRQRNPGECLAACAGMVLTYMGFSIGYARLLKLLQVRKQIGTPASNIRALEKLGVEVIYKQGTLAELHDHLRHNRPCIVFVQSGELPYWDTDTDHAVVVVGLDDQFIYLNDPAFPKRLSRSRMAISTWPGWSGMNFMLPSSPGKNLYPPQLRQGPL